MRKGIVLPQQNSTPDDVLKASVMAEEANLDSVWVFDHLRGRPDPSNAILEGWICLSAVAASTEIIGVGTLVLRESLRNPTVAAAMVETLEKVAPGRVTIGIGAGDETIREEQESAGVYFPGTAERYDRLEKAVKVVKNKSPQVPVWLGGHNPRIFRMLPLVNGWNYWGDAGGFPEHAAAARKAIGDSSFEISWAGRMRHYEPHALARGRPDHIILATSPRNYESRIDFLKGLE